MNIILKWSFWLWGISLIAQAQTPVTVDSTKLRPIAELLKEALSQNPKIIAARLEGRARGLDSTKVSVWPDPTVTVHYLPFPVYTARGFQRMQWEFSQAIPYLKTLRLRREIMSLHTSHALAEEEVQAQKVALEVKNAYFTLASIQESKKVIQGFQTKLRDFEDIVTARYEVGKASQQTILSLQVERHALTLKLETLEEKRQEALQQLAKAMNRTDLVALDGIFEFDTTRVTSFLPDTAYAYALTMRPEAHFLEHSTEMASREIELAKTAFWPNPSLHFTYYDIAPTQLIPTANGRDAFMVGLRLRIPLDTKSIRANIRKQQILRQQVQFQQQDLETDIQTALQGLTNQLQQQELQLDQIAKSLMPLAENMRATTLNSYTNNQVPFTDLLTSERMLFDLKLQWIEIQMRYLKTFAKVEYTIGARSLIYDLSPPKMNH